MKKVCFKLPTRKQVTFTLTAEQDEQEVRGNAMYSGDDAVDKQYEDEIIERLNNGDVWAWASVCVTASYKGQEGTDYLGGCCYKDEADFIKNSGYYFDMRDAAYNELIMNLQALAD